jgi:hypothetical protein
MRFLVTMNMPTKNGSSVHQIMAEHPSDSLESFKEALESEDFIEVEEFYRNTEGEYYSTGNVLLNHTHVGKVKMFTNHTHVNNKSRKDY